MENNKKQLAKAALAALLLASSPVSANTTDKSTEISTNPTTLLAMAEYGAHGNTSSSHDCGATPPPPTGTTNTNTTNTSLKNANRTPPTSANGSYNRTGSTSGTTEVTPTTNPINP
jgi:hypothetical protein